jgi:hypothetical protein
VNQKTADTDFVAFFFVRYDDLESLKAEKILRSIIRQFLDLVDPSAEVLDRLRVAERSRFSDYNDLESILEHLLPESVVSFVVIDGVDECAARERRDLFRTLESLCRARPQLRLFLSGRENVTDELKRLFPAIEKVSMASDGAHRDLLFYINEELQKRKQEGDLEFGDPTLFDEVKTKLVKHADGM